MGRQRTPDETWNLPHVPPRDANFRQERWWTPEEAAKAWGCSRATAYRLIIKYPKEVGRRVVGVEDEQGGVQYLTMVNAGCRRPAEPKGNPAFQDSEYQSAIARARERQKRLK